MSSVETVSASLNVCLNDRNMVFFEYMLKLNTHGTYGEVYAKTEHTKYSCSSTTSLPNMGLSQEKIWTWWVGLRLTVTSGHLVTQAAAAK